MATDGTAYKWWNYHIGVGKLQYKLCRNLPPPALGPPIYLFLASRSCGPAAWVALLLIKPVDVETNQRQITTYIFPRMWLTPGKASGRKNSAPKLFMMYEEEVQPYRKTDYKPIIIIYNNNKEVWICDIFHKQIHDRKQISINSIGLNTGCT